MKSGIPSQPVTVGINEITLGDRVVPYILKRSSRARLVWLRIKPQVGLTVTIPRNYQIKQIPAFLKTNSAWILRHLAKYEKESKEAPETQTPNMDSISYLGNRLTITTVHNQRDLPSIKLESNKLIINLDDSGKQTTYPALERWMKEQSVRLIVQKVKQFSSLIGVVFNRIMIRDQRSRWGSCSHLKNLSFNWRLIMTPEPVMDYVVIHELCHLKEMNHSAAFWALVTQFCPQWRERRKWLNKHSKELRISFPV